METIDLRSDTVTQPTLEMRAAMAAAEVGDDVYGEDPTVRRLEEKSAALLGKEAGLFVASGTMGNLASVMTHCQRGDEILLGDLSHHFLYEAGGSSALAGVNPHILINQPDGTLALEDLRGAVRPRDDHFPVTRLILLENTHNRCSGAFLIPDYLAGVRLLADEFGLRMHLDGARLFNAAAALGIPARRLADPFDSVTFCLSKGLCAPVGSILSGTSAFIAQARRARKQLGGGMRQAGVLAAAGLVALEKMIDRLPEDHVRARRLADGLGGLPGLKVENPLPATNMVYLSTGPDASLSATDLRDRLLGDGIKIGLANPQRIRLVTHYWIDDESVEKTVAGFKKWLASPML